MLRQLMMGGTVVAVVAAALQVAAPWMGRFGEKMTLAPAAQAATSTQPSPASQPSQVGAAAAMQRAADAKQYLFLFVYDKDDDATRTAQKVVESTVGKMTAKAQWAAVRRDAPEEKAVVQKFGLKNAPAPLVLAIAPNGAITGGILPQDIDEAAVQEAVVSSGSQACLKALQDRKVVLLCVQNKSTKSNEAAMKGVNDFKADAQFASFTEVVRVDPADEAEGKFLTQLKVDPKEQEAVTVFLAPPTAIIGQFKGATEKVTLASTLMKAAASGGCGPGGCAPGQTCAPAPAPQSTAK